MGKKKHAQRLSLVERRILVEAAALHIPHGCCGVISTAARILLPNKDWGKIASRVQDKFTKAVKAGKHSFWMGPSGTCVDARRAALIAVAWGDEEGIMAARRHSRAMGSHQG